MTLFATLVVVGSFAADLPSTIVSSSAPALGAGRARTKSASSSSTRRNGTSCPCCCDMTGRWATAGDQVLVTIAQTGCGLIATDAVAAPWSPASGKFTALWTVQMTFGTASRVGKLQGCSALACNAGSTLTWSDATVWTKQGAPGPAPGPAPSGTIALRSDPTVCLDSSSASNQDPIVARACVANSTSQTFSYNSRDPNLYIVLDASSSAARGCIELQSDGLCCVENWGGQCTVFGCDSIQAIKHWVYNASTGTITNGGSCMTTQAGAGVSMSTCVPGHAAQAWTITMA